MGPMGIPLSREEVWFKRKHSSMRMSVERGFGIPKSRFKEIGIKSSLKLDFLPVVVHYCCVLQNILFASKDCTLNPNLIDCNLPSIEDTDTTPSHEEKTFISLRPMGLVSEERVLLKDQMARKNLLDYLVRVQNTHHTANHLIRR